MGKHSAGRITIYLIIINEATQNRDGARAPSFFVKGVHNGKELETSYDKRNQGFK